MLWGNYEEISENIFILFKEYLWIIFFIISFKAMKYCRDHGLILKTPDHYYWFGMISMWLIIEASKIPLG